ncbi:hypothetical protein HY212_06635 [Candidatus Pacearchaeota archaeon]|nr:hypothetical protein [Candidatus Pacearchaeota archaeon]
MGSSRRALMKGDVVVLGGVQRRRDLFSEMGMDDEMGGMFGDMLNNMGFGNLGGGITQIKFLVVETSPNQPVIITEDTKVTLNQKSVGDSNDEIKNISEFVSDISEKS